MLFALKIFSLFRLVCSPFSKVTFQRFAPCSKFSSLFRGLLLVLKLSSRFESKYAVSVERFASCSHILYIVPLGLSVSLSLRLPVLCLFVLLISFVPSALDPQNPGREKA